VVKISTLLSTYTNYNAKLILDDGSIFTGCGFGYPKDTAGEVVFNTGMVGYTEALSDPSYRGQILCMTYPLIGNYGVPSKNVLDEYGLPKYFESNDIQVRGLVIHQLSPVASHWSCKRTLDEWLHEEKVPGIYNVDTREITKKIRVKGVMKGAISVSEKFVDESRLSELMKHEVYDTQNFMPDVSIRKPQHYGKNSNDKGCIVIIDTGIKFSIIRNVLRMGYNIVVVPWDTSFEKISEYKPRGVIISNGPGDPKICQPTIKTATKLIETSTPTLGICLGNQIIALAGGANTYKLKYGHRGQNKSCLDNLNSQAYITSQNHGYGISLESLKETDFKIWFSNSDDNTVEGILHKSKPILAVQFHPEASPGPYDCSFIFERFREIIDSYSDLSEDKYSSFERDIHASKQISYKKNKVNKKRRKIAKK
jgi:carbamoyl-phosphate synthase small subunit